MGNLIKLAKAIRDANHFGALHIVIEDENAADDDLAFCRSLVNELTPAEAEILDMLEGYTEREREAIIILADVIAEASEKAENA